MKRLFAVLVFIIVSALASGGTAHANLEPFRWPRPTICIKDQVNDTRWPLHHVVYYWDKNKDLNLRLRYICSGYTQKVFTHEGYYGTSKPFGWVVINYSGNRIIRVDAHFNRSFHTTAAARRWLVSHELGHAFGEAHTSRTDSVMRPVYYGYGPTLPTSYDHHEIYRLYPW